MLLFCCLFMCCLSLVFHCLRLVCALPVFMFCRCLCARARIIHLSAYNSSTSNDASICRALQTGRKVRYAQGGVFRAVFAGRCVQGGVCRAVCSERRRAVRIQSWCAYNSRGSARNAVILICRILLRLPVRTTRLTFLCPSLQPQYAETIHSEQLRASVSRLQAH